MNLQRIYKIIRYVLPILVLPLFFFQGVIFLLASYALFSVDVHNIDTTLGSLQSSSSDFTISIDPSYAEVSGPSPYQIGLDPQCNQYDEDFVDCLDPVPDLCPYIYFNPKNEEATEIGSAQNKYYASAEGQLYNPSYVDEYNPLTEPIDETDTWTLSVASPCFEGQCPADYDPYVNGDPLPQSLKGATFKCRLHVYATDAPPLSVIQNNIVYADTFQDEIEVSAVLTGESCVGDCFSNVLFLPGIKGSILKTGSDTLWPPSVFSDDIPQLAVTTTGESLNDVYTDGVLDTFYNTPIYEPYLEFMDELVASGEINKWLPMPYDWRFLPDKILNDGIKTATVTLDVIDEIEKLANESKTGKVVIIAHSMGGLLGKAIIKKLQEEGKDNLIDSFVMVATPQLGTPQAIASVLHGDGEGIAVGFIVNPIGLRRIAQNMPGAYNLLPSSEYFNDVSDPVVAFDTSSTFTQAWRNLWGQAINTYSNFISFLNGGNGVRTKPVDNELNKPEVLSNDLLASVSSFHNEYDNYQFPEHIRVVQIAGWGSPTTKAIEYKTKHGALNYDIDFTVEGDKTVVYSSAVSSVADETYFFNLSLFNKDTSQNIQHRDILNSTSVKEIIQKTIQGDSISETNYISIAKPPITENDTKLIVSSHSPVILGVYDQLGNFTGIDPNQDLSADILSIKEEIPGSTFSYTSDSQYIFLPKEGTYDFIYKGTGSGSTTVKIDNFVDDTAIPVVSYTDMPTTSSTAASFIVESSAPENTVIALDVNGDGAVDDTISADGVESSLGELLVLLRQKISSLSAKESIKQNLLKKIVNLEKKIENKKQKNAKILANLKNKVSKQEMKGKINTADATVMTNLLTELEAQAEYIALDELILSDIKTKIQSLSVKANIKNDLLRRVANLEKKQALISSLSNLSKNITKKSGNGKISDSDAQALLNIISQIETVI